PFLFFLPREYCFSLLFNLAESRGGYHPFPYFLNGELSHQGFVHYFLELLAIKTPLPILLMLAPCTVLIWRSNFRKAAPLLFIPWICFVAYFTFINRLDLGLRYVLPVYPFWLLTVAAPAALLAEK